MRPEIDLHREETLRELTTDIANAMDTMKFRWDNMIHGIKPTTMEMWVSANDLARKNQR
jgi:hypothetical protein